MALNLDHKVKIKVSVQPYLTLGPDDDGDAKNVPNIEIPTLSGVSTIDLSTFPWDNGSTGEYRWFYNSSYKIEWNGGIGTSCPTSVTSGLYTDGHIPDLADKIMFIYVKNLDMDQSKEAHGQSIYLTSRAAIGFEQASGDTTEIKAGESFIRKYQGPNIGNLASYVDDQVGVPPAYQRMLPGRQEDDIEGNIAFIELLYLARTDYT